MLIVLAVLTHAKVMNMHMLSRPDICFCLADDLAVTDDVFASRDRFAGNLVTAQDLSGNGTFDMGNAGTGRNVLKGDDHVVIGIQKD